MPFQRRWRLPYTTLPGLIIFDGHKYLMKINKEWRLKHKMALNVTFEQWINWHGDHQKHCSCRPIPEKLLAEMRRRKLL